MTVVMTACLSVILYITGKIILHQLVYITAASPDNFNPLGFKDIFSTLSHIPGKHDTYSHLTEHRCYSTLATAAFRRCHPADPCYLSVDDIKNRVISTMPEMVIHATVTGWYGYLHISLFLKKTCLQDNAAALYLAVNFFRVISQTDTPYLGSTLYYH